MGTNANIFNLCSWRNFCFLFGFILFVINHNYIRNNHKKLLRVHGRHAAWGCFLERRRGVGSGCLTLRGEAFPWLV